MAYITRRVGLEKMTSSYKWPISNILYDLHHNMSKLYHYISSMTSSFWITRIINYKKKGRLPSGRVFWSYSKIIMSVQIIFRENEKCFQCNERYCRNSVPTNFSFIAIYERPGLSIPAVHQNNKPGSTCVASDGEVAENNPISKSLRTKREKICNVYIKRKEMILNKLSGKCNFYWGVSKPKTSKAKT